MTHDLFDTHAHLQQLEFDRDRTAVIERARDAGLAGILVLGVNADTSTQAVTLAGDHEEVMAAAGCHPHDSRDLTTDDWETIRRLAHQPEVVSIGEIGLDFYRDLSTAKHADHVLQRQLELAREVSKPVAMHCRDAQRDAATHPRILVASMGGSLPDGRPLGVMHYFSGDLDLALRYIALGFLISVHTSVTHPNADRFRRSHAALPLTRSSWRRTAPTARRSDPRQAQRAGLCPGSSREDRGAARQPARVRRGGDDGERAAIARLQCQSRRPARTRRSMTAPAFSIHGPVQADLRSSKTRSTPPDQVTSRALDRCSKHVLGAAASGCGRRSRCSPGSSATTSRTCTCRSPHRSNCCTPRRSSTTT